MIFMLSCNHHHHPSNELSVSCIAETLHPLTSIHPSRHPSQKSPLCLYEFDCIYLIRVESNRCFSLVTGSFSFSVISSRFSHGISLCQNFLSFWAELCPITSLYHIWLTHISLSVSFKQNVLLLTSSIYRLFTPYVGIEASKPFLAGSSINTLRVMDHIDTGSHTTGRLGCCAAEATDHMFMGIICQQNVPCKSSHWPRFTLQSEVCRPLVFHRSIRYIIKNMSPGVNAMICFQITYKHCLSLRFTQAPGALVACSAWYSGPAVECGTL